MKTKIFLEKEIPQNIESLERLTESEKEIKKIQAKHWKLIFKELILELELQSLYEKLKDEKLKARELEFLKALDYLICLDNSILDIESQFNAELGVNKERIILEKELQRLLDNLRTFFSENPEEFKKFLKKIIFKLEYSVGELIEAEKFIKLCSHYLYLLSEKEALEVIKEFEDFDFRLNGPLDEYFLKQGKKSGSQKIFDYLLVSNSELVSEESKKEVLSFISCKQAIFILERELYYGGETELESVEKIFINRRRDLDFLLELVEQLSDKSSEVVQYLIGEIKYSHKEEDIKRLSQKYCLEGVF